jgi:hypothetical protein
VRIRVVRQLAGAPCGRCVRPRSRRVRLQSRSREWPLGRRTGAAWSAVAWPEQVAAQGRRRCGPRVRAPPGEVKGGQRGGARPCVLARPGMADAVRGTRPSQRSECFARRRRGARRPSAGQSRPLGAPVVRGESVPLARGLERVAECAWMCSRGGGAAARRIPSVAACPRWSRGSPPDSMVRTFGRGELPRRPRSAGRLA